MTKTRGGSRLQKAAQQASTALRSLARSLDAMGTEFRAMAKTAAKSGPARSAAPRKALSPAARNFLKLQGQYLGLVRHLPARHRAAVKALKAKKGYPAAIRAALKLRKA